MWRWSVRALVAVLAVLGEQVTTLQGQVGECFGDDRDRYAGAKARKNYGGTSPITRASGKKRSVLARFVHNDRLVGILQGCLKTGTLYE
jgi:hypothetical protein